MKNMSDVNIAHAGTDGSERYSPSMKMTPSITCALVLPALLVGLLMSGCHRPKQPAKTMVMSRLVTWTISQLSRCNHGLIQIYNTWFCRLKRLGKWGPISTYCSILV